MNERGGGRVGSWDESSRRFRGEEKVTSFGVHSRKVPPAHRDGYLGLQSERLPATSRAHSDNGLDDKRRCSTGKE